jgi:hypothetical protein
MAQFEVNWIAPEFEYREKDVSWYWITIIVAACIVAFAVWERNFLFGFFVVLAEILVIVWANREPRELAFALTDNGLSIGFPDILSDETPDEVIPGGEKFHSLKEFESWSAEEIEEGWHEIAFNFHAKLRTPLKILAPSEALDETRKNLKLLLREVEHQTTLIESIEKLIRF